MKSFKSLDFELLSFITSIICKIIHDFCLFLEIINQIDLKDFIFTISWNGKYVTLLSIPASSKRDKEVAADEQQLKLRNSEYTSR